MYRKFVHVVNLEMRADRQTDRHADRNTSHPEREEVHVYRRRVYVDVHVLP